MSRVKAYLDNFRRPDFLVGDAYVAGLWQPGTQREPVVDPATGEVFATAACCEAGQVTEAIDAAESAFAAWRDRLPAERGALLRSWAAKAREYLSELALLITCEQGKPLGEARSEVNYAASFLDWFAAEGERAYGETIPPHKPMSLSHTSLAPIGIAAAITPWNFPSAMITRKAAAALAAGCCMIVKPAPETPLSALALARLAGEAGIPPGVFQVVTGPGVALAHRLLDDLRVRAVSFTGSTEVGRLVLGRSAHSIKKVSLELGGHAPFIVFEDAGLDRAVRGALAAKFATSGQDCLAANRIYVQRGLYQPFVEAFGQAIERLQVGHGLQPETDIGPMTKLSVADTCRRHVQDALTNGASIIARARPAGLGERFIMPALLTGVSDTMAIAREETFGPVAAALVFDSEDEVLKRSNATQMGLAAYLYTSDLRRALRVSSGLAYGMVAVNTASFTGPPIPFGGWKQSGLGREGSRHGLSEYQELKYTCFGDLMG